MKIIDPHLHLFNLEQGNYHWLYDDTIDFGYNKNIIQQSFTSRDLQLQPPLSLQAFVHIEAGFNNSQPWLEIDYLENEVKNSFKSVAGLDITLPTKTFKEHLDKLTTYQSVAGIRDILDDRAVELLTNNNVISNLKSIAEYNLTFELQMPLGDPESFRALVSAMDELNNLNIVINHLGWPNIDDDKFWKNWKSHIEILGKYENIAIKCSGWEMTSDFAKKSPDEKTHLKAQTIKHCLKHFSSERVLIASNFPLCLFEQSYQSYWQSMISVLTNELDLNSCDIEKLCQKNARNWYKL